MRKSFTTLAIGGLVIISILSFTIPDNPHEIVPAMSIVGFDKPLWLSIMLSLSFAYFVFLSWLYDFLDTKVKRKVDSQNIKVISN